MDKSPVLWGVIGALIGAALQSLGVAGLTTGVVLLSIAGLFAIYSVRQPIAEALSSTVPLKVATKRFYEAARQNKSYWSSAADKLSVENSPAGRLAYCAHALKNSEITWSGVHLPSAIREDLPYDLVKNCSFVTDELDILVNGRTYSSIRVSKTGLRAMLKKVRDGTSDL